MRSSTVQEVEVANNQTSCVDDLNQESAPVEGNGEQENEEAKNPMVEVVEQTEQPD